MFSPKRPVAALLSVAMIGLVAAKSPKGFLKEVTDPKYKPGQVWSYKTRPGEKNSTLTVLRVEAVGAKRIVHIRVDKIRLKNCLGGPEPDNIEHMPFSREALDQSVIASVRTVPLPNFESGYHEWRTAWNAGKAGFYTITVAEAVEVSQKTFSKGLGCPN
jgi:hypothetical protein